MSDAKLDKIMDAAKKIEGCRFQSANEVLTRRKVIKRLSTGSSKLDKMLCGVLLIQWEASRACPSRRCSASSARARLRWPTLSASRLSCLVRREAERARHATSTPRARSVRRRSPRSRIASSSTRRKYSTTSWWPVCSQWTHSGRC